jgi:hypothetical protein
MGKTRKTKRFVVNRRVISDPRNVLGYLSHVGIHRIRNAKEIIQEARLWLDDEYYMWGVKQYEQSKTWPIISEKKLEEMVTKAMTKKYKERSSPMFSAADLCGAVMEGNDHSEYHSVRQGTTCVWKSVQHTVQKQKTTKKRKSLRK